MDRKEFLALLGTGTAVVLCSAFLKACKPLDQITSPSTNVDFTLDLTAPANNALKNIGGYIYNDNIIIAHVNDGSYVAVSSICTHQGGTVAYQTNGNEFHCPNHGSNFATNGSVINGPANSPLVTYKTSLNGTQLRITS
ncbi:MAG TPA: Rieske (2Fe-2S) protein [Bacteroidota bacterium]|nr:Rieske (2Fe-2S) protein [Bacteroidota bacterium]